MDPKLKIALAIVLGIVIGASLLGTAIALPAAFHAVSFRGGEAGVTFSRGMMGQQDVEGGYGMMGPCGGGQFAPGSGTGVCPNGGCTEDGYGMMGPRGGGQFAPGSGTGACPNGEVCPNGELCPNLPDASTSES